MDHRALLLEHLSEGQLEEIVAERIAQFHGLLTQEVALRLIAKEKGLIKDEERKVSVADIKGAGRKLTVEGTVKKIWPTAKYRSGKKSRVVEISDESGSAPLLLWNDDVDLAARLRTNDRVVVRNAYEKSGELHLGYSGSLEMQERAAFSDLAALPKGDYSHVTGFVSRVDGFDRFVDGSSAGFGFSFFLSDGKNEVQVVIWGRPERGKGIRPGDEIIIENALEKKGRLELSEDARLLMRRKERMLIGKVEEMHAEGDLLKVKVGGRKVELSRESGLKFLKADVAPDIRLSTLLKLKKDDLLNKDVAYKVEEKEGRIVIR